MEDAKGEGKDTSATAITVDEPRGTDRATTSEPSLESGSASAEPPSPDCALPSLAHAEAPAITVRRVDDSRSARARLHGREDAYQRIENPADLLPAVSGDGDVDSTGELAHARAQDLFGANRGRRGEIIDDRYELIRPIDEGGMGVVWLARSRKLEVDVAVKLTHSWRRGAVAAERMAREARTAAKLTHPAVVRIHDFGQTRHGDPYIAMELLQGRTLGRELDDKGPMSPVQAVQLLLPIVDALAAAHECGIVHRDLKPDNIFISEAHGRTYPKLLDFSLVKLMQPDISSASLTVDRRGIGTAPYLSPEQVKGLDDVDLRTDVWALCAVLYRATTGRAPFDGVSRYEVVNAVVHAVPEPIWKLGVADRQFWQIVKRGLRKDLSQRHGSMQEIGRELASWLLERGVTEDVGHVSLRSMWLGEPDSTPPRSPRRALAAVRLAVAVAVGAALAVVLMDQLGSCQAPAGSPGHGVGPAPHDGR